MKKYFLKNDNTSKNKNVVNSNPEITHEKNSTNSDFDKEIQECIFHSNFQSPIGLLQIVADSFGIVEINFGMRNKVSVEKSTPIIKECIKQLKEYFNGSRKEFSLPLSLNGTDFQLSVWNELMQIPYADTKTYSEIALAINNPKACRAVGLANNKNNIPIIIPCHRVIGKNKSLVGYAGGLETKRYLLDLESKYKYSYLT